MGHAYKMLNDLEKQHGTKKYIHAMGKLLNLNTALRAKLEKLPNNHSLSKKEVKEFHHILEKAEKEVVKIIKDAQLEVRGEIAKSLQIGNSKSLAKHIDILSKRGGAVNVLKFIVRTFRICELFTAKKLLSQAKKEMQAASKKEVMATQLQTALDVERKEEFDNYRLGISDLKKRAGVIRVGDEFRIKPEFSSKKIQKQFKSIESQNLSAQKRAIIAKNLTVVCQSAGKKEREEIREVTAEMIPLNRSFDEKIGLGTHFGTIFGDEGTSALNRQEAHLVNGICSQLIEKGKTILRLFRHGIISAKLETNPEQRAVESKNAAKELVTAALLVHLKAQNKTLKDTAESTTPIPLNLTSVSLITPDNLRRFAKNAKDERKMLEDQIHALQSLEGEQVFEIDGQKIKLNLKVAAFNFGVNDAAVGKIKHLTGIHMGLDTQYKQNLKAFQVLKEQCNDLLEQAANGKNLDYVTSLKIKDLMGDIALLMKDKKAYLAGENQYEIGAKIANLTHLMDEYSKANELEAGYSSAINCYSGKDRTGVMDAVAKTFALMNEINGNYPSHDQLKHSVAIRKQFGQILLHMLESSGGLEITLLNTGAMGYKITETANIAGFPLEKMLDLQGLSVTAKS